MLLEINYYGAGSAHMHMCVHVQYYLGCVYMLHVCTHYITILYPVGTATMDTLRKLEFSKRKTQRQGPILHEMAL